MGNQNQINTKFSRHIEHDFLKEDHKNKFNTKNQYDSQGCLKVIGTNSKTCQFLPKNVKILALNGQNFAISELSWYIEYDFLNQDHKKNFHTKIRKIHRGVWKLQVKNSHHCQFWPKISKFCHIRIFWHIEYDFLKEDHKFSFHT